MDAVRTIGECDAFQVQRAGLRVGRRGSGGRSNRQSPPCSRLLSRICAATISSGRFPVSSTRCRCATGVGEGMSRNPGDEAAGARRLLARLAEEGSALRQVRVGYWLAIRSAASGQGPRVPKRLVEFCLRQDWLEQVEAILSCRKRDAHGFDARKLRAIRFSRAASAKGGDAQGDRRHKAADACQRS